MQWESAQRGTLPGTRPKPAEEDAAAPRRVAAILESAAYRQADQDVDFLNQYDTRGVRLQLDYLKAELLLEQHRIAHTIVVFGSTRVPEPAPARQQVESLRQQQLRDPTDPEIRRRLAIAERIADKSRYYEMAREFGALVGRAGEGRESGRIVIMTGGGPGLMEAANRGAHTRRHASVGLNVSLPHQQYPNPYITPDLCFRFHYFALRKLHFLLRARALVVFPGGYGTLDELFETLTLVQTHKIEPLPVVLVGEAFWCRAVNFEFLVAEGVIEEADRELFWFAESAQDIWAGILRWHEMRGRLLLHSR